MPPPQNDKNEQDWPKAREQILGEFNANQQHLLTQNGHVTLTPQQQRQEGEYNCRDAEKAVDATAEWWEKKLAQEVLKDRVQTREKTIRECIAYAELHSGHTNVEGCLQTLIDSLHSLLPPNPTNDE